MKRPASAKASESPLKKPAACGESTGLEAPDEEKHVELTAEAVKDHNKFCEEAKDSLRSVQEKQWCWQGLPGGHRDKGGPSEEEEGHVVGMDSRWQEARWTL